MVVARREMQSLQQTKVHQEQTSQTKFQTHWIKQPATLKPSFENTQSSYRQNSWPSAFALIHAWPERSNLWKSGIRIWKGSRYPKDSMIPQWHFSLLYIGHELHYFDNFNPVSSLRRGAPAAHPWNSRFSAYMGEKDVYGIDIAPLFIFKCSQFIKKKKNVQTWLP